MFRVRDRIRFKFSARFWIRTDMHPARNGGRVVLRAAIA